MRKVIKFEIWIANLDHRFGTEAGKTRPVLIVQTDLLNKVHPSTLVCPINTNVQPASRVLRVQLTKGMANLEQDCDIMIDQLRVIDNRRFLKKIGTIPEAQAKKVNENLLIVLDLV
ncbi:type II toxin-antitoxin system PemK/MazF family toxin [Fontibacter flavus]|uniref:mRNA interferase n=1 Tax=Fontibacter flavus TaxID=654838 RepID=A0ABV6FRW8_9BACT